MKEKEYFVMVKQKGEGCDYTIGCGVACRTIQARNPAALYLVLCAEYDMSDIEEIMYTELCNMKTVDESEKKEIAEYQRLIKKFEGRTLGE